MPTGVPKRKREEGRLHCPLQAASRNSCSNYHVAQMAEQYPAYRMHAV